MESQGRKEATYVLVEYAFEYTAKDGRLVAIKPNERYMLLCRTNDHWWHVRKSKETRPFYIPAQYVKELPSMGHSQPPCQEPSPPTALPDKAVVFRVSTRAGQQQPTEYEYQFVSVDHEGDVRNEEADDSRISSSARTGGPCRDTGALPSTLSASHGSLTMLHTTAGANGSLEGCRQATEHIRSTVSLDDLARFTPPSQAGTGNSGLYKAASWGPPRQLRKGSSANVHGATEDRLKEQVQMLAKEPRARQPCEKAGADPVYVNLQALRWEWSPTPSPSTASRPQPHLTSPLADWETHTDNESGQLFYYNPVTGQTTWESPFDGPGDGVSPSRSLSPSLALSPATPAEWGQYVDEASGQVFFYNTATGETSWDAPRVEDTLDYPEMQPALARCYSPVDRRPPTPEADYPNLSPDEVDRYPEEDYSPVGSYEHLAFPYVPPGLQGWGCYDSQDRYGAETVTKDIHHHSTSSGSSLDSNPFGICPLNLLPFSGPKEEQFKTLEKAGMLHRTKVSDNGKRVRKNWSSSWTVLEGGVLTFFKDTKQSTSFGVKHPSVLSSPEHTVDLRGATLAWATKDKSSKKNVLELKTREGSEYLIQHDSETIVKSWHKTISDTIGKLPVEFPLEDNGENSADLKCKEQRLGSNREKESEKKSPASWHSSSSLNSDSDSSKVRNKLWKLLQRRPTLQSLRERGYIKDQVFGCPLQVLCDREKSTVPQFVRQCINAVENRGLDIDGLYRISGNLATIQKLRYKVDRDERLDLDNGRWDDVHVITGALKLFFRELPEPLFPFSHFDKFIAAIKIPEPAMRSLCLRELVHSLPPAHHDTMKVLFQHLGRVTQFREENRMSAQSLAIVFGPTLLKPEAEEGNMPMRMVFQNQIVEQILSQFSYMFRES